MTVNTAKVQGRRQLHFESLDDLRAELDRLSKQEVTTIGNWSFAQILMHLAIGYRLTVEGGVEFKLPWIFKLLAPLLKNRMIYKPMSPGFQLPKKVAKQVVADDKTTMQEALPALHKALDQYEAASQLQPHPMFGSLTREEWDQYTLRHAEMHLSFVVPA